MTGERFEIDPALPEAQRAALLSLAERLERERPLPDPNFRGELRRRFAGRPGAGAVAPAPRWQALAAFYLGAGLLCLALAAAGLAGAGPFAA